MNRHWPAQDLLAGRGDEMLAVAWKRQEEQKLTIETLPSARALALKTLEIARGCNGYNRANNRDEITKWLNLFGLPFADPQTGKPYAFCIAGLCWCACKAFCLLTNRPFGEDNALEVFQGVLDILKAHYFLPSALVQDVVDDAKRRGIYKSADSIGDDLDIMPGWFLAFAWHDDGHCDHVGIVDVDNGDVFLDEEFNTSIVNSVTGQRDGGQVRRQTRGWAHLDGIVCLG